MSVSDFMSVEICNARMEQQVLATVMLFPYKFEVVTDALTFEDFHESIHVDIFVEIQRRHALRESFSATAIMPFAHKLPDVLPHLTAAQYVARLIVGDDCVAYDLAACARELRRLARLRRVRATAFGLMADASDIDADPAQLIAAVETELFVIAGASDGVQREFDIEEAVRAALKSANAARESGGGMVGLTTGLVDLDKMTGGLQNSDLIVLAGRPSMGKTALVTNIARAVAEYHSNPKNPKGGIHFFSQEMSAEQLGNRILSEKSGVSSDALRRGTFSETQLQDAVDAADYLSNLSIKIDETGGMTMAQLATKARRVARAFNTSLIVVDYIQLMSGSGRAGQNRVQEVSEITTGLKALAKELRIPIIALSQLSRSVESREDKRPMLSDLRDSGSIEQDADVVMFVYRDDYYLDRSEPDEQSDKWFEWKQKRDNAEGKAEVIIAKSRHGPVGIVKMAFDASKTSFQNAARSSEVNAYASRS